MKEIAVLGSTGSIGIQTLEVIRLHKDLFHIHVLAARSNIELLLEQAKEFKPQYIVITDKAKADAFRYIYDGDAQILAGEDSLCEVVKVSEIDLVVVSVVGIAGLLPTLTAIKSGKELALANKETLVVGGELVTAAAKKYGVMIRPIDSEHSAIFQCLLGQDKKAVHKLILTASGGPFFGKKEEELRYVTLQDAMKHPTWNMGQKVTIDSATMFNKGLEVIEAHWLFNIHYDQIDVLVQPQSLIHSMVEFKDGSIIAQIGNPDMRLPIQFALTYPHRLVSPSKEFIDWSIFDAIKIAKPDLKVFRSLQFAYESGKSGGDVTVAFNAANEEAVNAFIHGRISFLSIFDVTEEVLSGWQRNRVTNVEDIMVADTKARFLATDIIKKVEL